jgi:hypothetical protein
MAPLIPLLGGGVIIAYLLMTSKKTTTTAPPTTTAPGTPAAGCPSCPPLTPFPPCPAPPAGTVPIGPCLGLDANLPAAMCQQVQTLLGGNDGTAQCAMAQQLAVNYPIAYAKMMAACSKNRLR